MARTGRPPTYAGAPDYKGRRRTPRLSDERWTLWVYNSAGEYMERITGDGPALRAQGAAITTVTGQKSWRCSLRRNGKAVAECKRGMWKDIALLEAKP